MKKDLLKEYTEWKNKVEYINKERNSFFKLLKSDLEKHKHHNRMNSIYIKIRQFKKIKEYEYNVAHYKGQEYMLDKIRDFMIYDTSFEAFVSSKTK